MYQEIRTSYRFPVAIHVEIWFKDRPLFTALGCNLSVEGMLLEVNDALLPIGERIMLQLHARNRVWSIPGRVIHSNTNCMGIIFTEPQPDLYRFYLHPNANQQSITARDHSVRCSTWPRQPHLPEKNQENKY